MDKWQEHNVNLDLLSKGITQFFTEDKYKVKLETTKKGFKIEATTKYPLFPLRIYVNIYGKPNNFTIEYTTDKTKKGKLSSKILMGYLASTIGAGNLLNYESKTQEKLDKIEKTFWEHVDKQVSQLTGSDKSKPQK